MEPTPEQTQTSESKTTEDTPSDNLRNMQAKGERNSKSSDSAKQESAKDKMAPSGLKRQRDDSADEAASSDDEMFEADETASDEEKDLLYEKEMEDEEIDDPDEMNDLNEDCNLTVEQLREKYYGAASAEATTKAEPVAPKKEEPPVVKETPTSSYVTRSGRRIRGEVKPLEKKPNSRSSSSAASTSSSLKVRNDSPTDGAYSTVALLNDITDDDEEDDDFVPQTKKSEKKQIRVGKDYQVEVADTIVSVDAAEMNKCEDYEECLWKPLVLERDCIAYQIAAMKQHHEMMTVGWKNMKPDFSENNKAEYLKKVDELECVFPDNGELLYNYYKSNFDFDVGLQRCYIEQLPRRDPAVNWLLKEIEVFESAYKSCGKEFRVIQKTVKTRSLREIVAFYYFWKKTARYERIKYGVDKGPYCVMDRFLDEADRESGHKDGSENNNENHHPQTHHHQYAGTLPVGLQPHPHALAEPNYSHYTDSGMNNYSKTTTPNTNSNNLPTTFFNAIPKTQEILNYSNVKQQ